MAKRTRAPDDFDSPWKDVLQAYFPAFLAFFFADIHADIDWSRGYQSLDKEFQKIARRARVGKQFVDKLFKVWLKDGREHWLLVHVEVQEEAEREFPERMFNYNAAVRQLYNREVVSLAILCDDQPDWRPTSFAHGRWGCKMELTFRIAKLLDHADEVDALEASDNPFAAVVLAHCKTLETRRNPESRRDWKLRVVKGLYRGGWSKEQINQLFLVIDWMMMLSLGLEADFEAEIDRFEEEKKMQYVSNREKWILKKAEDAGSRKTALESIALDLDEKFGRAGRKLLPRARLIENVDSLRRLMRLVKKAESLDKIEAFLEREQAPKSETTK